MKTIAMVLLLAAPANAQDAGVADKARALVQGYSARATVRRLEQAVARYEAEGKKFSSILDDVGDACVVSFFTGYKDEAKCKRYSLLYADAVIEVSVHYESISAETDKLFVDKQIAALTQAEKDETHALYRRYFHAGAAPASKNKLILMLRTTIKLNAAVERASKASYSIDSRLESEYGKPFVAELKRNPPKK